MHKKHHEKFKILDILAVTTQAREGIETLKSLLTVLTKVVTTQVHPVPVPGKKYNIQRKVKLSCQCLKINLN